MKTLHCKLLLIQEKAHKMAVDFFVNKMGWTNNESLKNLDDIEIYIELANEIDVLNKFLKYREGYCFDISHISDEGLTICIHLQGRDRTFHSQSFVRIPMTNISAIHTIDKSILDFLEKDFMLSEDVKKQGEYN